VVLGWSWGDGDACGKRAETSYQAAEKGGADGMGHHWALVGKQMASDA